MLDVDMKTTIKTLYQKGDNKTQIGCMLDIDRKTVRKVLKENSAASKSNLSKCKIQGKYAGTVTGIHKGSVFVCLQIGINAITHSCYDSRMPGKKDDVSFVVTRIDEERNVTVGLISRIIRQNI